MSHFTVAVRLTAARLATHDGVVKDALAEILAPFDEASEDPRFIEFEDEEDGMRKAYETESTDRIKCPDGALLLPWDKRFQKPGTFGHGSDTHAVPPDCERISVPFRETYPTFDAYAKDWCGHDGPKASGRYGHYHNPNAKWDWYLIGGRWRGHFPLKAGALRRLGKPGTGDNVPERGYGDVVRVSEIDLAQAAIAQKERATDFWRKWQTFLADPTHKSDPFDGPRPRALDLGLLRVEQKPVVAPEGEMAISWESFVKDANDPRRHWTDVARIIDEPTFFREHADDFDPIATYAGLDDAGWVEPGRMGWFGCSSATAETRCAFKRSFRQRFINDCGPDDMLVAVDCHI